VFVAMSGSEALTAAKSRVPDLVLLNMMLPDGDGIDLCRRLKADQALHQPHVMVFSSAVDKAEWLSPALEGGADDYLSLPVTNRELLARIKVQLRLKHALDLLAREVEAHLATQAELRQSETILRRISESIEDVLWMITPDFARVVYLSPAYETLWGRERSAVYEEPGTLLHAIHPEDREGKDCAMKNPRVLLADDHQIILHALKGILESEFQVVDTAANGVELIEKAEALRPDILVVDVSMPLLGGIEAVKQLRKKLGDLKVVFLTMHSDLVFGAKAMEAGAKGYVLKHATPSELLLAVREAAQGRTFVSPAIAGQLME